VPVDGSGGGVGGGPSGDVAGGGGTGAAGTSGGGGKSAAVCAEARCATNSNALETIFRPSLLLPAEVDQTATAMASISTRAPFGSPATCTVARAGGTPGK